LAFLKASFFNFVRIQLISYQLSVSVVVTVVVVVGCSYSHCT